MRIVGGKYRHRLINFPLDMAHTRPTKDRIREAIFSALGDITNAQVLDLYAGSGAMGLEALSRGAKKATFVDVSPLAVKVIKTNLDSLKIHEEEYRLIKDKDSNALKMFREENTKFDLIFLDPPYDLGQYQDIVNQLIADDLLNKNAVIVIEANHDVDLENIDYQKKKAYHYGDIKVCIYWR